MKKIIQEISYRIQNGYFLQMNNENALISKKHLIIQLEMWANITKNSTDTIGNKGEVRKFSFSFMVVYTLYLVQ